MTPALGEGDTPAGPGACYSQAAIGEQMDMGRYLPLAWRMVADAEGNHYPPRRPEPYGPDFSWQAYWLPLIHLCHYALGWPQPELGLARWLQEGKPTESPVLQTIERWWGDEVADIAAWGFAAQEGSGADNLRAHFVAALPEVDFPRQSMPATAPPQVARPSTDYWASGDPCHFQSHVGAPMKLPVAADLIVGRATGRRAALFAPSYAGWYRRLYDLQPKGDGLKDWSVEVTVKPLGWLGTYRRSRRSGLWFGGQHRWHNLGLPEHARATRMTDEARRQEILHLILAHQDLAQEEAVALAQALDNFGLKALHKGGWGQPGFETHLRSQLGKFLAQAPIRRPLQSFTSALLLHLLRTYW